MCADCQREAWREAKSAKPKAKRKAHGPVIKLKDNLSEVVLPGRNIKPSVLFVDRHNGRLVLCEVMSETPIRHEATIAHICQFYAELGYRVVDVVEVLPVAAESAAD